MDRIRAQSILSALANGAHPLTGEVFPPESPYQSAEVVRALFVAVRELEGSNTQPVRVPDREAPAMNSPQPTVMAQSDKARSGRHNAGKPWSAEEDRQLVAGFDAGQTVRQLAELHGRGASGIEARLVKLGRMEMSPKLAASLRSNPMSPRMG